MKSYESIPKWRDDDIGKPVIAFDKLDGSNIRAEWNPKKGFYKFGSRHLLIDASTPLYGKAVILINEQAEELSKVCVAQRWQSAVLFFEFYGPGSFAGAHNPDELQVVTLIDANVYKRGIIPAREFLDLFGHLSVPRVLFTGPLSSEVVESVREGTLEGMTFEGVVCKHPNEANVMFKVKSKAWLDKLREQCGDDENLFKRLA